MGIDIFGKFDNRQVDGKLMDYKDIDKAPIIEQDLNGSFSPIANNYYRHTGSNGIYISGVVYYFNGTEYKALDGSGDLRNVQELETEQVIPGAVDIDKTVTKNSENVVTSDAVYNAINAVTTAIASVQDDVNKIPRITVDKALNSASTNPVENKAVNSAIQQLNSEISRVENKVVAAGDYVDKESVQTITGTKVFKNIQVDEILFQTQDGNYGCTLYAPKTESQAIKNIYLPESEGTLSLDSEDLLTSSYERITTSENNIFDSKISIPLKSGFTFRKHTYEIEWTYDNIEASHQLTMIGDLMLDAGSLTHEDKYICHTAYPMGVRVDFYAMISIDDEDSSDNGKLELGVNIQGSSAGSKYIYVHSIRAKAR